MDVEFHILGPIEVWNAGERLGTGGCRQSAVLAALLANPNTYVSRRRLIELVWDAPPDSAEANLRSYLARLRRVLTVPGEATSRVHAAEPGYRLNVGPEELDYTIFERLANTGDRAADAGDHVTAADCFGRAAALWRGEALGGAAADGALTATVAHLNERHEQVRIGELRSRLELGQYDRILARLRAGVSAEPANETLVGLLMLALHRSGRPDLALEQFHRLREHLDAQLGIEPNAHLSRLYHDIRANTVPSPAPVLAQLPACVSTFTGRQRELGSIRDHVARARRRGGIAAVALHGVAGVGKTALAVRAAHALASEFPGGQLFLDLHGSRDDGEPLDSGRALHRLLRALGFADGAIPGDMDERVALYRGAMARRRMTLVLDNAADERQVLPLIPGGPDCCVIITSRVPLHGLDHTRPLEVEDLDSRDAVDLFRKISGADADPAITDIIEACGRLPLVIRRVARRLRGRPGWSASQFGNRLTGSGGWRIHSFT